MSPRASRGNVSRSEFLRIATRAGFLLGTPGLLAACAAPQEPERTTALASPSAAPGTPQVAATRGPSRGELRVSEPFLPATLDPDVGTASFNLMSLGVCESLMRYTETLRVEPWIAKSLDRVDDLTWRVVLRDDVTFWDGTRVDAEAVRASFVRTMEKAPGTADLLPRDTVFTADGQTLTIRTPMPVGMMRNNLAAPNLAIKKVAGDQFVCTGPFRPTAFTARESIALEAYAGYRGGPPALARITARQLADTAARSLAVQAGDMDVAQALLPSDVSKLRLAGVQVDPAPWARQHMIVLNPTREPLNDVAVRRALSLLVDRKGLIDAVLDGVGEVAQAIAPASIGIAGLVDAHRTAPDEAKRVLDAAGWRPGPDGVRVKDGKRLAFKLGTYSGRAELEQFAVAILDMAKAAGMELSIEKLADVEQALASNAFDSTMYSIGSAAFGDVSRLLATLYTPSPRNKDRYSNERVNAAFGRYIQSSDAAEQARLFGEMQRAIGDDVPIVPLVNPYQVVAYSKKVRDFKPHPLDSYKYTEATRLDA